MQMSLSLARKARLTGEPLADLAADCRPHVGRGCGMLLAREIVGQGRPGGDDRCDRRLNGITSSNKARVLFAVSQPAKTLGGGEDHRHRIGAVFPRMLGCRTMDWLEHPVLVTDVATRRHAHSPLEHRGEIGDDVSEHVGGHAHVVLLWLANQPLRERVDDRGVLLDVRVLRTHFVKDLEEELTPFEDVVLSNCGDALLSVFGCALRSPTGELEGTADHALRALAGDDAGIYRQVAPAPGHLESADSAVQAFCILPDDHHVGLVRIPDRHVRSVNAVPDTWPQLDRSDVGVEVQPHPVADHWRPASHLSAGHGYRAFALWRWPAHGAKQDEVRLLTFFF